jgi:chromosome segregation ATPase
MSGSHKDVDYMEEISKCNSRGRARRLSKHLRGFFPTFSRRADLARLKQQTGESRDQVKALESEIASLDGQIKTLSDRRTLLTSKLGEKQESLAGLAQTVATAEASYAKLLETSQTLLAHVKKESTETEREMKRSH